MMFIIFIFFFQAEDGIRDKLVTGVQTCALPISGSAARCPGSRSFVAARQRSPAARVAAPAKADLTSRSPQVRALAVRALSAAPADASPPIWKPAQNPTANRARRRRSAEAYIRVREPAHAV